MNDLFNKLNEAFKTAGFADDTRWGALRKYKQRLGQEAYENSPMRETYDKWEDRGRLRRKLLNKVTAPFRRGLFNHTPVGKVLDWGYKRLPWTDKNVNYTDPKNMDEVINLTGLSGDRYQSPNAVAKLSSLDAKVAQTIHELKTGTSGVSMGDIEKTAAGVAGQMAQRSTGDILGPMLGLNIFSRMWGPAYIKYRHKVNQKNLKRDQSVNQEALEKALPNIQEKIRTSDFTLPNKVAGTPLIYSALGGLTVGAPIIQNWMGDFSRWRKNRSFRNKMNSIAKGKGKDKDFQQAFDSMGMTPEMLLKIQQNSKMGNKGV